MVIGRIIEYDSKSKTYKFPQEHAAFMTRAAGFKNMNALAGWLPTFGFVEDGIVESFKNGGGVPSTTYHRLHELMAERNKLYVPLFHNVDLHAIPGLLDRLKNGCKVLDVG